jgi:hypothetical protein
MNCKNTAKWLYRNGENFSWQSDLKPGDDYFFKDNEGIVRLILEVNGQLTVLKRYTWNGCSPKFCILDLLLGTPEGAVYKPTGKPKTYYASMVHDALYQFLDADAPITREQADHCFLKLMEESEFVLAGLYWFQARVFGRFFWRGQKKARQWRGKAISVQSFIHGT